MLNVLGIGYTGQIQLAVTQNIVVALSMPLWPALERRMGKRNAYMIGIACMCAYSISWIAADRAITTAGMIARGVLGGFGSGGMILLSISMLADALAYDRELTGCTAKGCYRAWRW